MKAKLFFFVMLGVVGATLGGSVGLFYLMNGRLSAKIGELAKRHEEILIITDEIANLETLNKQLKQIENIRPLIDAALPKNKTQSESVAQILDVANINGVNFTSIGFAATEGLPAENSQTTSSKIFPSVSSVPITLETQSVPYTAIKEFLRDIFAIRRTANVSNLIIIRDPDNPGYVSAKITVDVHLEKVAEVLTEAEKAERRKAAEKAAEEAN